MDALAKNGHPLVSCLCECHMTCFLKVLLWHFDVNPEGSTMLNRDHALQTLVFGCFSWCLQAITGETDFKHHQATTQHIRILTFVAFLVHKLANSYVVTSPRTPALWN